MKLIQIAFTIALVLALGSSAAHGQRATVQRQGNRQQQQAAAMTQAVLVAIAAQSDPLQLVYRKDVQRDLQMDLGQRNRFDNLHDRQMRDIQQARMQNRRNQAVAADLQLKQQTETQSKIDELLTIAQKTRLSQISLQLQGNVAILTPDVQKKVGLTVEQIERAKQIKVNRDSQIEELRAGIMEGTTLPVDINTAVARIQKDMNDALGEVLTPEQTDQLKKLMGAPFKAG